MKEINDEIMLIEQLNDDINLIDNIKLEELEFSSINEEKLVLKRMLNTISNIWEYLIKRSEEIRQMETEIKHSDVKHSGQGQNFANHNKLYNMHEEDNNKFTMKVLCKQTCKLNRNKLNETVKMDIKIKKSEYENKIKNKKLKINNYNNFKCHNKKSLLDLDYNLDYNYYIKANDTIMEKKKSNNLLSKIKNTLSLGETNVKTDNISKDGQDEIFSDIEMLDDKISKKRTRNLDDLSSPEDVVTKKKQIKSDSDNGASHSYSLRDQRQPQNTWNNNRNNTEVKEIKRREKKINVLTAKFESDDLRTYYDHESNQKHKKDEIIKKFLKWNKKLIIDSIFLYFKSSNKSASNQNGKYTCIISVPSEDDFEIINKDVIELEDIKLLKSNPTQLYFIDVLKIDPNIKDADLLLKFENFNISNQIESIQRNKKFDGQILDSISLMTKSKEKFIELVQFGVHLSVSERYETEPHPFKPRYCSNCYVIGCHMSKCKRSKTCYKCNKSHNSDCNSTGQALFCVNCKKNGHCSTSIACSKFKRLYQEANLKYYEILQEAGVRNLKIEKIMKGYQLDRKKILKINQDVFEDKMIESDEEEKSIIDTIKKLKKDNKELQIRQSELEKRLDTKCLEDDEVFDAISEGIDLVAKQVLDNKNQITSLTAEAKIRITSDEKIRAAERAFSTEFLDAIAKSINPSFDSSKIMSVEKRLKLSSDLHLPQH